MKRITKTNIDDLLIQLYEFVPHKFIPSTIQLRIATRIITCNYELEQEITLLK